MDLCSTITRAKGDFVIPGCRICQCVNIALLQELPWLFETHVEANHHPNPDSKICVEEGNVWRSRTVQLGLLDAIQMILAILGQHCSVPAEG